MGLMGRMDGGVAVGVMVFLAVAVVVLGARKPGYSHLRHTISELGEVGARDARWVAWGLFFPVGLGCLALGLLWEAEAARLLALALATGYLVAALFPCDVGSPPTGSARQAVHNLGGAVQYIGGALALLRLASESSLALAIPQAAGMAVGAAALGLSLPFLFPWRGLIQRVAETILFSSLLRVALG